ncbi:XRE family transcriptional regulator, partial [Oceanobacillus caeni]
ESEVNAELEKGYTDFIQGDTKSVAKAFSEIRRDHGI